MNALPGLDLDQLRAFAVAIDAGTMESAAARLHVTPSAISQRIKALESTVGQVLVIRSRPLGATASGVRLLRAARQIETIATEAVHALGDASGRRVVALAANADSLATWLVPALASVPAGIVVDVRRADETQTAQLLRDGTVMAAVTASREPLPGCSSERLGRMRYRPRASQAFAARWFASGVSAAGLAAAPVVAFDRDDALQDRYLRRRTRRKLDPPRHYVPGSGAFVSAVRLGMGWGMVPDLQADGRPPLVEIDPAGTLDVGLYWQQWRLASTAVQEVAQAIRREAAAHLK